MLEKDPSVATQPDAAPKSSGALPGGPFQKDVPPTEPDTTASVPYRHFTFQYLLAVIKKPSNKE